MRDVKGVFKKVHVCCGDGELRQRTGAALKAAGANDISFGVNYEASLQACRTSPPSVLIVWWLDAEEVGGTRFLQMFRRSPGANSAVIILLAAETTASLLAIAAEYSAYRVLTFDSFESSLAATLKGLGAELERPSAAEASIQKLQRARDAGRIGEADAIVQEMFGMHPLDPRAILEYANLAIRRNDWEKATKLLAGLSKNETNNVRVLSAYSRCLMHTGEYQGAIALLNKAELLSPHNVNRLVMLGDSLMKVGEVEKAKQKYQSALKVDSEERGAKNGLGAVALTEGQFNEALEIMRGVTNEQEKASIFNTAGVIATKQGRFDDAAKMYSMAFKAVESKPLKSRITFNLGLCHRKGNRLLEAEECFKQALELDDSMEKARVAIAWLHKPQPKFVPIPTAKPKPLVPTSAPQPVVPAEPEKLPVNSEFAQARFLDEEEDL